MSILLVSLALAAEPATLSFDRLVLQGELSGTSVSNARLAARVNLALARAGVEVPEEREGLYVDGEPPLADLQLGGVAESLSCGPASSAAACSIDIAWQVLDREAGVVVLVGTSSRFGMGEDPSDAMVAAVAGAAVRFMDDRRVSQRLENGQELLVRDDGGLVRGCHAPSPGTPLVGARVDGLTAWVVDERGTWIAGTERPVSGARVDAELAGGGRLQVTVTHAADGLAIVQGPVRSSPCRGRAPFPAEGDTVQVVASPGAAPRAASLGRGEAWKLDPGAPVGAAILDAEGRLVGIVDGRGEVRPIDDAVRAVDPVGAALLSHEPVSVSVAELGGVVSLPSGTPAGGAQEKLLRAYGGVALISVGIPLTAYGLVILGDSPEAGLGVAALGGAVTTGGVLLIKGPRRTSVAVGPGVVRVGF